MSGLMARIDFRHRFGEVLLGLFIIFYAGKILPYVRFLYTREGILPWQMTESLILPSIDLPFLDTMGFAVGLHVIVIIAGALLVLNLWPALAAGAILLAQWYLYNRNTLTFAPDTGFLQAALLILAFRHHLSPRQMLILGWLALGVGYTYSGFSKLDGDLWTSGRALRYFFLNSDSLALWVPSPPDILRRPLMIATYLLLFGEIAALGLVTFRLGRVFIWGFFIMVHLANIALFDFVQLSLGCALVHVLIYQWSIHLNKDLPDVFKLAPPQP